MSKKRSVAYLQHFFFYGQISHGKFEHEEMVFRNKITAGRAITAVRGDRRDVWPNCRRFKQNDKK